MKVKIIKADEDCWYTNRIGEVFAVTEEQRASGYYLISGHGWIIPADCRIVSDTKPVNLCETCKKYPCGVNSPIGISKCYTEVCVNYISNDSKMVEKSCMKCTEVGGSDCEFSRGIPCRYYKEQTTPKSFEGDRNELIKLADDVMEASEYYRYSSLTPQDSREEVITLITTYIEKVISDGCAMCKEFKELKQQRDKLLSITKQYADFHSGCDCRCCQVAKETVAKIEGKSMHS